MADNSYLLRMIIDKKFPYFLKNVMKCKQTKIFVCSESTLVILSSPTYNLTTPFLSLAGFLFKHNVLVFHLKFQLNSLSHWVLFNCSLVHTLKNQTNFTKVSLFQRQYDLKFLRCTLMLTDYTYSVNDTYSANHFVIITLFYKTNHFHEIY